MLSAQSSRRSASLVKHSAAIPLRLTSVVLKRQHARQRDRVHFDLPVRRLNNAKTGARIGGCDAHHTRHRRETLRDYALAPSGFRQVPGSKDVSSSGTVLAWAQSRTPKGTHLCGFFLRPWFSR
jgi:hypothetical protein